MSNIISKAFFAVSAALVARDLYVYWDIHHAFRTESAPMIILLGILAHFAFERRAAP